MIGTGKQKQGWMMIMGIGIALVMIAVAVWLLVLRGGTAAPAAQAERIVSQHGIYTLTYKSEIEPIPLNQMHSWTIHLEKEGAGLALDGAEITVDGGMPAHGHGLPTQPQMTRPLGNGNYLIEGFRFQMPGRWVVNFTIRFGNEIDTAVVELDLK